ncbi:MAG: DUF87 domain-containing protein [Vampirovibrionales bacterium]|nr:DUF87 domain-containing protein [Vampirovibrionales bacterium]
MLRFLRQKFTPPSQQALQVSKNFSVPLAVYADTGERDAILASSGMGKSYLTGVLMEETLENGGLICVIDPEGEHFTLSERYPMLIIGGERGQLPLSPEAFDLYFEAMLQNGFSAVFDLSELLDVEQQAVYGQIADSLFRMSQKYRRKIRLIVEEAQIYAPQRTTGGAAPGGKNKGPDPLVASQRIAKRGRKRAIDSLWATQRPASISKDILSQCNRFWFGGISAEQDYKAIKPFLTEAGISFADIRSLKPGEFFFYSKGQTHKLRVRKRFCKHAGATPNGQLAFQATSDRSLDSALRRLAEAVAKREREHEQEEAEVARLKAYIRQLEKEKEQLKKELEQEKLATKVIERLDGSSVGNGSRKSSRASSVNMAEALAAVNAKTPARDMPSHPDDVRWPEFTTDS